MEIRYVEVPRITDERGSLSFMETGNQIPFEIKRVFYISDLKDDGKKRGEHAHFETEQVLFCIQGNVKIGFDDGKEKQTVELSESNRGVCIPKMIWHWMEEFSEGCIMLVVASDVYRESDYIRNYENFLEITKS